MTIHPFRTRAHVLGLPIGHRALDWSSILGSALAVASFVGTVDAALALRHRVAEARRRWASRMEEGKELLEEGEDIVHHAAGIANTVSGMTGAVSKVGGGGRG